MAAAAPLAVLGGGAIGQLVAAHAARAGRPVSLLLRPEAHERFQAQGRLLRLDVADAAAAGGWRTLEARLAHSEPVQPAARGGPAGPSGGGGQPLAALLLATKATAAAGALRAVAGRLGRDSVVALTQNGAMGLHERLLDEVFPDAAARPSFVLISVTHGAHRLSEFHARHAGAGQLLSGLAPPAGFGGAQAQAPPLPPSAEALLAALEAVPELGLVRLPSAGALRAALSAKLACSCVLNPLTALLRCRNGALLEEPHARRLLRALAAECAAVLAPDMLAGGGDAGDVEARVVASVEAVVRGTAANTSSMLTDVAAGAQTEVDFLTGHLLRLADARGIPAPTHALVFSLIKAADGLAAARPSEPATS
jgi:2-dehydropantoate 2-reductase